jgi:hypothetical protein
MSKGLPLLLLCLLVGAKAEASREIGYVIDAHGAWYDSHQQRITPMYLVYEDSQLVRKNSPSTEDYIRIRSFATGKAESFECKEPLKCNGPLDLSGLFAVRESTAGGFLEAIRILVSGHREAYQHYARALSRNISVGKGLEDGVARVGPDGLDLENIFRGVPLGTYLLELCVVNGNGDHNCGPKPEALPFFWKPGENPLWKKHAVAPGLYQLNVCEDVEGRILRSPESVFVIAAKAEKYDKLRSEFDRAADQARAWARADPPDPAAASVLRAYMHYLSLYENR